MKGQSKIRSFFTSQPAKRKPSDINGNQPPAKVAKSEDTASASIQSSTSLSPEQERMIESKRQAALVKLDSKHGAGNMGASWKAALSAEFHKDYFKKVINN